MANIAGTSLSERINALGTYYWDGATWVFLNSKATTTGADTVHAGSGNDQVDGGKGNDSLFGDAGNDLLIGGSGNDLVDGGVDDDIIYGGTQTANASGSGTDDLRGGLGNDVIHAGDGNDKLSGDDGNDKLFGEAGNDDLNGGAGIDILVGGAGADKLAGGAGGDLYVLNSVSDSQATAAGAFNSKTGDVIDGFTSAAETATVSLQDKIDLRGLVSQIGHALTWSGAAPSSYGVWSSVSGGNTFVNIDTTGDHIADVVIKITTTEALTAGDIITDATAPTVSSTAYGTPGGSLNAGDTVTLAVTFSEAVLVSGVTPTLTLNSGGTATYLSGSGSSTLAFTYTVAAGQNTSDLAITSLNLNSATITDAAGNNANISGATSNPSGVLIVDTVAPSAPTATLAADSGASNSDGVSNVGALSIGSEAGAMVEYSTNGGSIWISSFTPLEGSNALLVRQTDTAGNVSGSTSFSFTLDTANPAAPDLALASDTGSSGNDLITSDGTLSVGGEVGAQVEYSTDGGTTWNSSFTPLEGSNTILVRQTDVASNVSAEAGFNFVLDSQAPSAPGLTLIVDSGSSNTDHVTNNGALSVTGIETGASVEYSIDGGAHWQSSFTPQFGLNSLAVRQTDAAGNFSIATDFVFSLIQEGYVIDGYIAGATVFADADGNGQLDIGEYSAITDNSGHFVLQGGSGDIIVIGGTDTSTNIGLTGKLTAPSGSAVVSPLTTLITLLVNDPASNLDVADAEAKVLVAFGLAPDTDLLTLDPITSAFLSNADPFLAGISVLNTVSMVAAAIAGAGGDQDAAATSVFSALANQILGLGTGEALDLTNSSTIGAIAEAAATGALDASLLQALEDVVVASNQTLMDDAATASTPLQLVTDATATAFVAQGGASDALAAAADDPGEIDTVVNSYTGNGLDAAVNSALNQIGDITPAVQAHAALTEGTDNFGPSSLNTKLISEAPDLNPTDSIDLGGGYDVLALFGNGSFDLNGPSVLAGVDEVRLTYVSGAGPSALTLRDGMDVSVSVSGSGNETSIYLSSGNVSLDLDGINGGFYHLSSGTAIIDGSDSGFDDSSYYFSTGEATVSDANAGRNRYYLSSGAATIHAGGAYDFDDDRGYNYYYLADGTYALHGADTNQDIFVLNNAAQLQAGSLIDGGTGSYDDDGSYLPIKDTVVFNGAFDITAPFSTAISNIEAFSIGGTLKVNQANLAGLNSISGGTLTTEEAALDLSGMTVSSRIESSYAGGTTFTVTDASTAFHVYGGDGNDTLIASGFTLSANQRDSIFLNSSVETIIDGSGTYVAPLQLTAGADTLAFDSSDLTNSTLNATAPDLNPTDSIDLGGGYDVLALFGNGSFDLNGPSVLAGVDEVRLTYVSGAGPSALTLRDGMDVSVSVSGSGNETSIYLSSGNVSLDLDGINGGFYHLSSGTAIIDGSDSGFDDSSYYFSTGEATVSDANAGRNRYYLSSGAATIHAGGAYDFDDDRGYNYYYLADGTYALHGADTNQDIFVLNNAAQLQAGSLIDGGTGSYDDDGSYLPIKDTVVFNGAFDITAPFSTAISNIEAFSIGGTLKVNQANLAGLNSISGGTLTTEEAALDLSGMTVSSRIESSYAGGTTFTVTDASTAFHVYGGDGNDTLIASGFTLSANQRDSIFLNSSVETIIDGSGTYVAPLQLTAGADTLAFDSSDLTNSTLNATAPDLNPTDSIDLGGGYDVLALFGNGSFDLNGPSVLAGVDEVRLTYVSGAGPSALTLRDGMDVSVSVSGSGNETSIYLSSGNVSLDLDGINGGFYHLSSGTAIIDGSDSGFDDSSYYFSTGEATVSDANAGRNRYYLSSGAATIHAGGAYDFDDDRGYNYYYLADGTYALHGADTNQDIFVLNNAAQLQAGSLIDGGTGSYDDDGSYLPIKDTVVFNGAFDITAPFSTAISNIEAFSIGGTLKVNQANLAGLNSISGGTLTTEEAALDLSGMTVSSRIESSYAGGTTFTVTDASTAFHVYGGDGNDTLIASGFTLSANQRDSIFLNSSVEAIRDNSGLYGNDQSNVLYAIANDTITGQGGSDTFVFSAGFASAVITDFTPGTDIIRIPDELFATSQILDYATQQNADVVFDALTGDTLRLYNINLASLSSGDFDLV